MRLVTDPCDFHSMDIDALHNSKDFIGSTNGSLTSFLGIPFAQPPYASIHNDPFLSHLDSIPG
jgi:hypothetical protein